MIVSEKYPINYSLRETPPTYKCSQCGKEHVKLWRYYQTVLSAQELFCADCAIARYKEKNSYDNDLMIEVERKSTIKNGLTPAPGITYMTREEYENSLIFDEDGYRWETAYCTDGKHQIRMDQIGSLIPAVPTEANDTFWGYTSVPQEGVNWWRNLPTY